MIAIVAAELLVKLFTLLVIGTVPALEVTVTATALLMNCAAVLLAESVKVLEPLLTPVPPFAEGRTDVPCTVVEFTQVAICPLVGDPLTDTPLTIATYSAMMSTKSPADAAVVKTMLVPDVAV